MAGDLSTSARLRKSASAKVLASAMSELCRPPCAEFEATDRTSPERETKVSSDLVRRAAGGANDSSASYSD